LLKTLVDHAVAVGVLEDVRGKGTPLRAMNSPPMRKPGAQLGGSGGLELVRDVQAVAPVVQLDVEGVLRAEERVRVALAGGVVLVLRPRVVDEETGSRPRSGGSG
jgi:hypothetical protein